jgi:hypothetical protein
VNALDTLLYETNGVLALRIPEAPEGELLRIVRHALEVLGRLYLMPYYKTLLQLSRIVARWRKGGRGWRLGGVNKEHGHTKVAQGTKETLLSRV